MNGRILLSIVGLGVIVLAFIILYEFPAYTVEAFVLLLVWMVTNFVLLYALRPRGPPLSAGAATSETSPFPSSPSAATAPLPSRPGVTNPLGFCIYCAAPVSPGTRVCPACGHAVPQW